MSNVYGAENTFFIDEVEATATMQRTACTTKDATENMQHAPHNSTM